MPEEYGTAINHNNNEFKHHMSANTVLYKWDKIGTLPLFLKYINIPEYINGEVSHKVTLYEINRLDNISYKYYGTPELFWVIMYVNNIINPFDIKEGTALRILPLSYIEYSILRYNNFDINEI